MLTPQTHYQNSKGEMVDPRDMATPHLNSALAKAQREGHQENIQVLSEEIARREALSPEIAE